MTMLPPRGWPGVIAIGGHPRADSNRTPIAASASSNGPTGRRWKYFCAVNVIGESASDAKPIMK